VRFGQVPLALVHAQLDALADAEEDIEAELADLDVIDLASEVPILSDAARRVMQFAQLSRFMKAGVMPELGIQRRPAGPPDFDGPDFSIGDLHRLVLELPSVPVEKLRRECVDPAPRFRATCTLRVVAAVAPAARDSTRAPRSLSTAARRAGSTSSEKRPARCSGRTRRTPASAARCSSRNRRRWLRRRGLERGVGATPRRLSLSAPPALFVSACATGFCVL